MAYEIGTVADGDITAAQTVALGGNYRVYISSENARLIGTFKAKADVEAAYTAATHGTLEQDSAYPTPGTGFGTDNVVAVVKSNSVESGDDDKPKLTMSYFNSEATPAVIANHRGVVELDLSSISEYQDVLVFQRGYSRDVIFNNDAGDAAAADITANDEATTAGSLRLIAATGAQHIKAGGEISLFKLPDLDTFKLIVQTDSFADPSTVSNPISVPAGLNSSRWVTAGMTPEPEITFTQKFVSNSEIVQRLSGRHVTLMVEILKNDQVLSSRAIYTEAILNWSHDSGEGEAPVMRNSTARFKDALYFFTAP